MSEAKKFLHAETDFRGRYANSIYDSLFQAYRPIRLQIFCFLALGFIGRGLLLSNANIIGYWVDSLCRAPAQCRPVPSFFSSFTNQDYLALLATVTFVGLLLNITFRIGFSRQSARAVSRLYDEVTFRTSRLPMKFFDTNPVGRIMTRFSSDYGSVFRLFGGPLAEFFAIIFDLILMLGLIFLASPILMPVFLLIGGLNYLIYRRNKDHLRKERRALSAIRSPSIAHFAETTQGASTIRIFSRQSSFFNRFSDLNSSFLSQRLRTYRAILGFSMKMSFLTSLLFLLTGLGGYYLIQQGLTSIGSIGVAFAFITLSGASVQMFFEWLAQFEEAMTGVERLDDYLRRDLEPGLAIPSQSEFSTGHPKYTASEEQALQTTKLTKSPNAPVALQGVWFRYQADLPWVLKGVDFEVRAGEKLGIIGRTGSGKSSLIQALFGLYPVEKGHVRIDGKAPSFHQPPIDSEVDLQVFRRSVAYIAQEPTLFRSTLRENLSLGLTVPEDKLHHVITRVGLSDWFKKQPNGLNTFIEEKGRNLSAGERQLVCMARCLLQDAPVVVMDEATSSVDPQTEEVLVRATEEFFSDRTQIIIAHRLSTLQNCNRILWLDKGEVRMLDRPEKVLPVFTESQ